MKYLLPLLLCAFLSGCNSGQEKFSLKGSWYSDFQKLNPIDTLTGDYTELYFDDSIYYVQNIMMGQSRNRKYFISRDSIYFGDSSDDMSALYKIISFNDDTLWLKANPKYLKNLDTVYYVKFPKDEYGHYDLTWSEKNKDSLNWKVQVDYERRMWKHQALKSGKMKEFDSLERAGNWRWTVKELNAAYK